jgi:hypothetical protein
MQYALLIYLDPRRSGDGLDEDTRRAVSAEYYAIRDEADVIGGAQLGAVEHATTVRMADGRTLTTDGPFADSKEVFGGFYLLEADNIERALELAARVPAVRMGGAVEVRPILEPGH